MKVAIIGSRGINSCDTEAVLRLLPTGTRVIISGGAGGVDAWAEEFARLRGFEFVKILPDYQKYGKRAPAVRNRELVRRADYVLAVWDYKSRGTAHAIVCCIEEGVPVRVVGGVDSAHQVY